VIVHGDRIRTAIPAAEIAWLRGELEALAVAPPGLARHSRLVGLLIAGGELAQGLADQAFARRGEDRPDRAAEAAMALTTALGRGVWLSHLRGHAARGRVAAAGELLDHLERLALPPAVRVTAAEGFREHALYPESYAAAAAAAFGPRERPLVLGVRSIGTALAAMVAAVAPDRDPPLTVRPIGHPFARRLALGEDLRRALGAAHRRQVAIVDDGPGLSGSSFGAALDAVEAAGVPARHVHAFPSHLRPPPLAAAAARERWVRTARHVVGFEALCLGPGAGGLRSWTEDLTGPETAPAEDLGGGRWRARLFAGPERWPPAHVGRERRKLLLHGRGRRFLARFVGLGRHGERRLARAARLGEAGFSPPALGLRHGFLVQPWLDGARPLSESWPRLSRRAVVARVADYLAFRATAFPAAGEAGARPAALLDMAMVNTAEALGEGSEAPLGRFEGWIPDLERAARPVEVDARLHAWEWLAAPDGRLWKCDAIDHCDGHDLVGCQDVAWDLAGAAVELDLADDEVRAVRRRIQAAGVSVEPESLAFYRACYLAFQLGWHRLAARAVEGFDPAEAARLDLGTARYARLLDGGGGYAVAKENLGAGT